MSTTKLADSDLPIEGDIYKGKVVKIETFGAFISLPNYVSHGLIHISQISKERIENVTDAVSLGDELYVKVLTVEVVDGRPRISLSMKHISQVDGTDRDPNGVQAELETRKRKSGRNEPEPIQLDAIYNTTCSKCGGGGHIASECYNTGSQKYELVPDIDDESLFKQNSSQVMSSTSVHSNRDRSRYGSTNERGSHYESSAYRQHSDAIPQLAPMGRGRGTVLPAWMTLQAKGLASCASGNDDRESLRNNRKRSRSSDPDRYKDDDQSSGNSESESARQSSRHTKHSKKSKDEKKQKKDKKEKKSKSKSEKHEKKEKKKHKKRDRE